MRVNIFLYIGVVTQMSCGRRSVEGNLGKNQTKFRKTTAMKNTLKHLLRIRMW